MIILFRISNLFKSIVNFNQIVAIAYNENNTSIFFALRILKES